MNVGAHFAAVITVGCIGAAFGSVTAALVGIYKHRRETLAAHRAATAEFIEQHRSFYTEPKFWAALAAGMACTLGLLLITSSDARISASAYSSIVHIGGPNVWGSVFVGAAAVTWLCAWRYNRWLDWALLLQALPFAGLSLMFAIASVRHPDANITAAPVYAWIMIMHACLADYARRQY